MSSPLPFALIASYLAYSAATSVHFTHNALYLESYPNLPTWLSRGEVFASLLVVLAAGVLALLLYMRGFRICGLLALGAYAALGYDGLAHYALASVSSHSLAMNATIVAEVVAATCLLVVVVTLFGKTRSPRAA